MDEQDLNKVIGLIFTFCHRINRYQIINHWNSGRKYSELPYSKQSWPEAILHDENSPKCLYNVPICKRFRRICKITLIIHIWLNFMILDKIRISWIIHIIHCHWMFHRNYMKWWWNMEVVLVQIVGDVGFIANAA